MDVGAYRWYANGKEARRVSFGSDAASPPQKGRGLYFIGYAPQFGYLDKGLLCSETLTASGWRWTGLDARVNAVAYGAGVYVAATSGGLWYSYEGDRNWT